MTRQQQRHVPFACPRCSKPLSRVLETRAWQGGIRRRRRCEDGHTIWTREVPVSEVTQAAA